MNNEFEIEIREMIAELAPLVRLEADLRQGRDPFPDVVDGEPLDDDRIGRILRAAGIPEHAADSTGEPRDEESGARAENAPARMADVLDGDHIGMPVRLARRPGRHHLLSGVAASVAALILVNATALSWAYAKDRKARQAFVVAQQMEARARQALADALEENERERQALADAQARARQALVDARAREDRVTREALALEARKLSESFTTLAETLSRAASTLVAGALGRESSDRDTLVTSSADSRVRIGDSGCAINFNGDGSSTAQSAASANHVAEVDAGEGREPIAIAGLAECAKCSLKETSTSYQCAVDVEEDGKTITYYLLEGQRTASQKFFPMICKTAKKVKATCKAKEEDGKQILIPLEVEIVEE